MPNHIRFFAITADDVDEIARRVTAAGGAITMQKSHTETVGTLICFKDTEGNCAGAMKYNN
jgi:predicted enzyme related to lactoylglutathione lyase